MCNTRLHGVLVLFVFSFFEFFDKVNYNAVLKSGRLARIFVSAFAAVLKSIIVGLLSKRKEGKKKWDYRYIVLTTGHLCWFKDKVHVLSNVVCWSNQLLFRQRETKKSLVV